MMRRSFLGSTLAAFASLGEAPPDEDLRKNAKERLEIAQRQFREVEAAVKNPPIVNEPGAPKDPIGVEELTDWSLRIRDAELDLAADGQGRTAAMKAHIARLVAWEKVLAEMVKAHASVVSRQDLEALAFFRLEGEAEILRSQKGA